MVNTHQIPPASHPILHSVAESLQQLTNHTLTSQRLVQLAESFYMALMEGQFRDDRSPQANQLRETLSDITAQWEMLLGNLHDQRNINSAATLEFPSEWVQQWLQQVQSLEKKTMAESPKNQPTFNITQVGNINTGDATIQRDQIGIQHNYATNSELHAVLQDLKESLNELQKQNPDATTETQAYEIIEAEFTTPTDPNRNKLATLRKQLLNPERHLQASKATLAEIAKHYLEESVWAKALITYLDTMSTDPEQGA